MKVMIVTKPAVYVAIAVLEQIVERLEEESWINLLERLVKDFLEQEDSSNKQNILVSGALLAREFVFSHTTKMDVMMELAN